MEQNRNVLDESHDNEMENNKITNKLFTIPQIKFSLSNFDSDKSRSKNNVNWFSRLFTGQSEPLHSNQQQQYYLNYMHPNSNKINHGLNGIFTIHKPPFINFNAFFEFNKWHYKNTEHEFPPPPSVISQSNAFSSAAAQQFQQIPSPSYLGPNGFIGLQQQGQSIFNDNTFNGENKIHSDQPYNSYALIPASAISKNGLIGFRPIYTNTEPNNS